MSSLSKLKYKKKCQPFLFRLFQGLTFQFQFLKNSVMLIDSKMHSKSFDYLDKCSV